MKSMKKILFTFLSLFIVGFLFFTEPALAQDAALEGIGEQTGMGTDFITIIGNVIRVFLSILGVILLGLIIYAGYLWMTAGGDPEKVQKAKDVIIRAVIGLLIVMASFAITTFLMRTLSDAIFGDRDATTPQVPPFSNSLGNGGILDHYPMRNQRNVPRNTRIIVQFRTPISPGVFIDGRGYNDGGTPNDITDDTFDGELIVNEEDGSFNMDLPLDSRVVCIRRSEDNDSDCLPGDEVSVVFTPDLRTYVFRVPILGNSMTPTDYTVSLSDSIRDLDRASVIDRGGYRWNFQVSTELDLTPPRVQNVIPANESEFARNVLVQITFDKAMDPTTVSGFTDQNFRNITVTNQNNTRLQEGTYEISNGFRTVTFTTNDLCGQNSCGQDMFCLDGDGDFEAIIKSPTNIDENSPPQVTASPYPPRGATDASGNALDGRENGVIRGENNDYNWNFRTTNEIVLDGPVIEQILPKIRAQNVPLDQPVEITFGEAQSDLLASNTVTAENILFRPNPFHELWYMTRINNTGTATAPRHRVLLPHGVLLASGGEAGVNYAYGVQLNEGLRNIYQNCFNPAQGPDAGVGVCVPDDDRPYCCDGVPEPESCISRD